MDTKISLLTETTTPGANDVYPIVQGGVTKKIKHSNVHPAETDPVFTVSEAYNFASGDKAKLDGITAGANTVTTATDKEVTFNDGGGTAYSGDVNLKWDKTNHNLNIGQGTALPTNPLIVSGDSTGYLQSNLQNRNSGNDASSDIVVTSDNGSDTTHYVDLGKNSSTYNDSGFSATGANDSYLTDSDDNLVIGVAGIGKATKFIAEGTTSSDIIGEINVDGIDLSVGKTYRINGTDITKNYNYGISTGILTRGVISANADTTKINISQATSLYVDNSDPNNTVIDVLTLPTQTAITPMVGGSGLDTLDRLWIGIQRTAPGVGGLIFSQQFTPAERRTIAILGRVWSNGTTTVENFGQYATPAWGGMRSLEDWLNAFGNAINIDGNKFTPHTSSMLLDKDGGHSFRYSSNSGTSMDSPNTRTDAAQTGITSYHYHLAADGGTTDLKTAIDPDYYDLAGTKTSVTAAHFTIQRIYYFPGSGVVDICYGQAEYMTLQNAKDAVTLEDFTISDASKNTLSGAILRGWICVQKGATDLTNATQASIIPATDLTSGSSASGGGTTDHSVLSNLDYAHAGHTGFTASNGAITGATKTKITYDTKGLVTAGADATTADIADSSNARYCTDAQKTVIGNTSGTNTGDNATNSQYSSDYRLANFVAGTAYQVPITAGDVTTSGATSTIGAGKVTLAQQANMATASVIYRKTAGSGAPEVQTLATLKTDLGLTGTNSGDQSTIVGITGTIAQFNTACTDADFATGGGTATGSNTGDQTLPTDATIATTDITTNNVSTSKHGFFPKLPAPTGKFLKDDLTWQAIAGGGDMLAANNLSDVASTQTSRNNILPSKTGNSLKVLRVNTGETDYELVDPPASMDVACLAIQGGFF